MKSNTIQFLNKQSIFNSWSKARLAGLQNNIKRKSLIKGSYVYRQGSTDSNYIYIVVNGELEMISNIPLKEEEDSYGSNLYSSSGLGISSIYKKLKKTRKLVLFKLVCGNLFGDEDQYISRPKSLCVQVISDQCIVLQIPIAVSLFFFTQNYHDIHSNRFF